MTMNYFEMQRTKGRLTLIMSCFHCNAMQHDTKRQCSRKRVQQLKKRKKSCFFDFQKRKNV